MLRIGEFSFLSGLSINTLRNYDKIGILIPCYVDNETGYRYYLEENLITANQIKAYRSYGLSLKQISELLYDDTNLNKYINDIILENKKEIENLNDINRKLQNVLNEYNPFAISKLNFIIKELPELIIISYRDILDSFKNEGELWQKLYKNNNVFNLKGLKGSFIFSDDGSNIDIEVFQQVESIQNDSKIIQKSKVVSYIHKGAYDRLIDINSQLLKWIKENKYVIIGSRILLYHVSPGDTDNKEEMITEICYPIKKLDSIIV